MESPNKSHLWEKSWQRQYSETSWAWDNKLSRRLAREVPERGSFVPGRWRFTALGSAFGAALWEPAHMISSKGQAWEANSLWSRAHSEWKRDATTWMKLEDILLSGKKNIYIYKRINTVWFYLYEALILVKLRRQKSKIELPGAAGEVNGELVFNGQSFSSGWWKVLWMDGGDCCTIWRYSTPLNGTLKSGWDFPGSPVTKPLCFHSRGHRFNPCSGNWDPTWCVARYGVAKTKRE